MIVVEFGVDMNCTKLCETYCMIVVEFGVDMNCETYCMYPVMEKTVVSDCSLLNNQHLFYHKQNSVAACGGIAMLQHVKQFEKLITVC
jgi:hypothetical protein